MSAQNFTFPPPPPPPPKSGSLTYSTYAPPFYSQSNGSRGRAGRVSGGRGRGDGHRGSRSRGQGTSSGFSAGPPRDGGYFPSSNSGYSRQIHTNPSSYPLPEYPQEQYPPFRPQHNSFGHYPPLGDYPQTPAFETTQPMLNHPYSSNLSATPYTNGYSSQPYGPPQPQSQAPLSQPTIMGPPIRMGFDNHHPGHFRSHPGQPRTFGQPDLNAMRMGPNLRYHDHGPPHRQRTPNQHNPNRHVSPNHFNNNRFQGLKRGTSASQRPPSSIARPQAAPAVPSFGNPLPLKPPAPSDSGKKPRKKKRKHNQLGLTPKAEEHESSEEEEDVDEEAKLAAMVGAVGSNQKQLQFTYKGQTATLQTSSDIAAWIEERKKKFPTKARAQEAAERKRVFQEAQKASNEALKQKQETRKNELRERQKQEKAEEERKGREEAKLDPRDAALKAKIKAEKLRRRLNKEERRVTKAEAKAEEARVKAEAVQNGGYLSQSAITGTKRKRGESGEGVESVSAASIAPTTKIENEPPERREEELDGKVAESTAQEHGAVIKDDEHVVTLEDMIAEASTVCNSESQPAVAAADPSVALIEASATLSDISIMEAAHEDHVAETDSDSEDTMSISSSSPEPSDDDDTSSSGSSPGEDTPDEAPSKRSGPERVPPPQREKPKSICRQFLKTGHCRRGERCKFLHELPERGSARAGLANGTQMAKREKAGAKPKRKRLYERLVEQEKEKEDQHILQAIVYLGQSGFLDPTIAEPAEPAGDEE